MSRPREFSLVVTFSYDDGRSEDRRLVELLNKYNLKATFHLNSGTLGKKNYVTKEEVATLYEGHEVSAHTVTHPHLYWKTNHFIRKQIEEDVQNLTTLCGYPIRGMSYPYGDQNKRIRTIVRELGLEYSRTVQNNRKFEFPTDPIKWNSNCHDKDGMKVAKRFFNTPDAKLLYIWGHSYELTEHNGWDKFEELCKFVSNRDDVWYATNIDVIDYMNELKNN